MDDFGETVLVGLVWVYLAAGIVAAVVLAPVWIPVVAFLWVLRKIANRWG